MDARGWIARERILDGCGPTIVSVTRARTIRASFVRAGVGLLVVSCSSAGTLGVEQPSAAVAPHASAARNEPESSSIQPLVPVTRFTSPVDGVTIDDLSAVVVLPAFAQAVHVALPRVQVTVDADPLARVRDTGEIALIPPSLVNVSVKTLSINGRYYWDAGDAGDYPLRVVTAGGAVLTSTKWKMVAAGEMIFGRGVQERIERHQHGDASSVFTEVRAIIRSGDLAVATLEAPLSGNANQWCDTCMRFVGNERYAAAIAQAGFGVVSLAANHIGDAGPIGVLNTIRALDSVGIAHAGAGADRVAAHEPAFVTAGGQRVAVLAYNDVPPASYAAGEASPGSAQLTHEDPEYRSVRAEIAQARARADVVIVLAHWGIEYEDAPQPQVVAAAHAMIEAGAAVVIGDHPHWVQSVESYRGAFITYGIGNFVFDQMWSMETREGSIEEISFDGVRPVAVRIRPTIIDDYYRPRLLAANEAAYRDTLARIWRHSIFK